MKLASSPEEINAQCALPEADIVITDYNVEVMPPSTTMFERIAYAARTCYRSEGKATPESDKQLIRGCVKRGHTSVLEHGAISVFFNIRPDEGTTQMLNTILNNKGRGIPMRQIWDRLNTLSMQRFANSFADPDIFSKHADEVTIDGSKLPADADISLPVIIADVRAWREILRERLFISDNVTADPVSWIVTVATANQLYKLAPEMFFDIMDDIFRRIFTYLNRDPSAEKRQFGPIDNMLLDKITDEEKKNFDFDVFLAKFFPKDYHGIIAAESSPSLYVTLVFDTDRAVTHEHVRHRRDVGYSQESQRFVNYAGEPGQILPLTCDPAKAPDGVEIDPYTGIVAKDEVACKLYEDAAKVCFATYAKLREIGFPPEAARKILPNGTHTKIVVTWLMPMGFMNFMRWRTEKYAQYDIRHAADEVIFKMFEMNHPFLINCPATDLSRFINWMKEQDMFNEETMKKLDQHLQDRIAAEEKVQKQYEEDRRILEERRAEAMRAKARAIQSDEIVVDDHTTKPVPDPTKPPATIKVGAQGAEAGETPNEQITERPPTVQVVLKDGEVYTSSMKVRATWKDYPELEPTGLAYDELVAIVSDLLKVNSDYQWQISYTHHDGPVDKDDPDWPEICRVSEKFYDLVSMSDEVRGWFVKHNLFFGGAGFQPDYGFEINVEKIRAVSSKNISAGRAGMPEDAPADPQYEKVIDIVRHLLKTKADVNWEMTYLVRDGVYAADDTDLPEVERISHEFYKLVSESEEVAAWLKEHNLELAGADFRPDTGFELRFGVPPTDDSTGR